MRGIRTTCKFLLVLGNELVCDSILDVHSGNGHTCLPANYLDTVCRGRNCILYVCIFEDDGRTFTAYSRSSDGFCPGDLRIRTQFKKNIFHVRFGSSSHDSVSEVSAKSVLPELVEVALTDSEKF